MTTTPSSRLWDALSDTLFDNIDDQFVASFRRPGGANSRLGSWDPFDKTMRYFKFMLFSAAERQQPEFFEHYRRLRNIDVGAPVSVKVHGCAINIDYLMSVQEYMFMDSCVSFETLRSVVEIGAGFGRTCHTLLSLSDAIERYTIVDLPNVLALSRRVLAETAPDRLEIIEFIDATNADDWRGLERDLAINIDSFQEMLPGTIDAYLTGIVSGCRHFYTKNTVAKYEPSAVGIEGASPESLYDVFSLGYCRNVIDIFDDRALAEARQAYVGAYRPSADWKLVADKPAELFSYFHQAFYSAA